MRGTTIEDEIAAALQSRVRLPNGSTLVIEQTEAMVSIDVNTASFLGGKNLEETVFQTNMEAAAAIPRQLRLRNLGGIVVIDFIDMTDFAHQQSVLAKLSQNLAADPAKTRVLGFSELGLVQVSRKRVRESLVQQMCGDCPHCQGSGLTKTPESVCMEIFRALLSEASVAADKHESRKGSYSLITTAAVADGCWKKRRPFTPRCLPSSDTNCACKLIQSFCRAGLICFLFPKATDSHALSLPTVTIKQRPTAVTVGQGAKNGLSAGHCSQLCHCGSTAIRARVAEFF